LRNLVDLVGIEPTTSSMPFPSSKYSDQIANDSEGYGKGGVHAGFADVRCPLCIPDWHSPTGRDLGRDRTVTTQTMTQVPTHPPALKQGWGCSLPRQAVQAIKKIWKIFHTRRFAL